MYPAKIFITMEKRNFTAVLNRLIPGIAAVIAIFVLFVPPKPGVADQGDFQRVMDIAGLQETESSLAEPESRFIHYVKAEYNMTAVNPLRVLGLVPSSSMIYPVILAKTICKMAGLIHFNTEILAAIYTALYIAAIWMCLCWIGIKREPVKLFAATAVLVVLMDGNYLVWFNSLYGEPMMIIGLLLFTAAALYAIGTNTPASMKIWPVFIGSLLFLGAKPQCITALPFIMMILVRIISVKKLAVFTEENDMHFIGDPFVRKIRKPCPGQVQNASSCRSPRTLPVVQADGAKRTLPAFIIKAALSVTLLSAYTISLYLQQNETCGVDTKYNAVFYGILKNSEDPQKDLEMLGLSGDLAIEAGKHAYLPSNEYARYIPWSEITQTEFNEKISNFKLIRFYLLNPRRLINGMKYTASQSFQTGTFLGKYKKTDRYEYTYAFHRFTFWSDFRSAVFPKKLWFIVLMYLTVFLVSAFEYRSRRQDHISRQRIELLWMIMAIGIFQFPMPFIGNGEADTAKQLFLFNFTFDILVIIASIWVFSKLFFSSIEALDK